MIDITVVIPAFNASTWIVETLRSVLEQDAPEIEVILVDDGSTDDTAKLVTRIAENDPRLRIIGKHNTGVSDTRNAGLREAKGRYVVFLDADDVLSDGFLKTRMDFMDAHPEIDICGSDIEQLNESGTRTPTGTHAPGENALQEILLYDPVVSSVPGNMMYRVSSLRKHDLHFETRLSSLADKYFLVCAANKGLRCAYVPGSPLYYRVHSSSMSYRLTQGIYAEDQRYVRMLIEQELIPLHIQSRVLAANYYILAGMARRLTCYADCVRYLVKWIHYRLVK